MIGGGATVCGGDAVLGNVGEGSGKAVNVDDGAAEAVYVCTLGDVGAEDGEDSLSWFQRNNIDPIMTNTTVMPRTHSKGARGLPPSVGFAPAAGEAAIGSDAVRHPRPSQYSVPGLPLGSGYQPGESGLGD